MDSKHRSVIALLKSAITQIPQPLPEMFSLEQIMPLVKRHHMISLVYDGAVCCGVEKTLPGMKSLFEGYCKSLLISNRQMGQIRQLYQAFDAGKIDYMPLKGCNMKDRYPKPELRMMGDADILIRLEQYEQITKILQELGFQEKNVTDHELVWENSALHLELHKHLIPSYNVDFYAYFGAGWDRARIQYGYRYAMSPEDEWIFLFTHFSKHYRDGGIGCRHVVDLWVYLRQAGQLDQAYVEAELEKLHLLKFYQNVLHLIDVWFEDGKEDQMAEYMTQYIFSSGSWGQQSDRLVSRTLRDSKHSVLGFSGKLVYIWHTLFPARQVLQQKYTVLKKHSWMLPVVWVIRPFYKLLFEPQSLKKQKENLSSVNQKDIKTRQDFLNYVGLDYQ